MFSQHKAMVNLLVNEQEVPPSKPLKLLISLFMALQLISQQGFSPSMKVFVAQRSTVVALWRKQRLN